MSVTIGVSVAMRPAKVHGALPVLVFCLEVVVNVKEAFVFTAPV